MDRDDPFASVAELCQISSSQQEQLSRCRFAGEPEDESLSDDSSGGIPVASTGIVMLSLPDSPEDNENDASISRDNDVFHTPPEESSLAVSQEQQQQKNVVIDFRGDRAVEGFADNGNFASVDCNCVDDARAVDLGRDTDLGFSAEVEVTERIEIDSGSQSSYGTNQLHDNKVIHFESINFRIKEGELNESDGLGETPAKKLKLADKNLGLNTPEPCLGSEAARTLERVAKSIEKLKSPSKNSKILDENVVLESSSITSGIKTSNFVHSTKLSFEGASPQNCLNSLQNHQNKYVNRVDKEFQGDGCAKRKLQFHSKTLFGMEENEAVSTVNEDRVGGDQTEEIEEESEMEDYEAVSAVNEDGVESEAETEEIEDDKTDRLCNTNETSSGANSHERQKDRVSKSIDDIDKFRYVRPGGANSSGKHKDFGVKRALPVSLLGNNSNAQGEVVPNGFTYEVLSTSNNKDITVLEVLRELAKDYTSDPGLAKLSVLEAAKRGGMTFP